MKRKWKIILAALVVSALFYLLIQWKHGGNANPAAKEVIVHFGDIQKVIVSTGAVQPQNRLEMKPPVAGRVDKILVQEGQDVKAGDPVALMSSTERAALLDAAKSKGPEELSQWEDIYKPIPLVAPIDGKVIVSTMQPGQTVTSTDAIIVLSDRLIVQAQVDETDIGRVKEGQKAAITLDAYPDIEVNAVVGHIYYESQVVNNVTIYKVNILPETVPDVFRSGMSANVRIIEESKEHILLVPLEVVKKGKNKGGSFVLVKQTGGKKPERRDVQLGISDDNNVEIISGVEENDTLVIPAPKAPGAKNAAPKASSNPFMPSMGGQRKR